MTLLEVSGLSLNFGTVPILTNTSVDFHSGELLGLIGPNGAGKTTLLRAACGLLRATSGSIRFLGKKLQETDRKELARNLAYLPQNGQAHWSLSVADLVLLGRLPHRPFWKGPSAEDRRIVSDALRACDVVHLAKRPIDMLSGGERSRVMLARSLAVEPRLLLADEPVTGLDPLHQLEAMEKFRSLADSGIGVVIVIHDLSLAARYCDRLALVHDRRIVADNEPARVLCNEYLNACFGVRFKIEFDHGIPVVLPLEKCAGN
ncbi:MAG: ABC transporter ATP-binding protein [Methylococcaceae bacterium]|nr:ABC transporter ATP-binding protein [Methylococcaceae bacterium]